MSVKTFISIPEPTKEALKYDFRKFITNSNTSLFVKINIILYFIFMLEKILSKYL